MLFNFQSSIYPISPIPEQWSDRCERRGLTCLLMNDLCEREWPEDPLPRRGCCRSRRNRPVTEVYVFFCNNIGQKYQNKLSLLHQPFSQRIISCLEPNLIPGFGPHSWGIKSGMFLVYLLLAMFLVVLCFFFKSILSYWLCFWANSFVFHLFKITILCKTQITDINNCWISHLMAADRRWLPVTERAFSLVVILVLPRRLFPTKLRFVASCLNYRH